MRLMWNALGTAVLAETASDTDATNQSYYGETKLHFLVRGRLRTRYMTRFRVVIEPIRRQLQHRLQKTPTSG